MKKLLERLLIKLSKLLNIDLLAHAHVQIGVGHNTYLSGEEVVINTLLRRILKKDPAMIFDVGANIGEYAVLLRKAFKEATIHCFEPMPDTFAELEHSMAPLNIHCHPFGFSSREEMLDLHQGSNNSDGSMATIYADGLNTIFMFAGEVSRVVECRFDTIDNFCNIHAIVAIDFLKIDVEGHELEVLKGAARMIEENRILVVQFEFNEFNIISRSFMKDFYNVLSRYDLFRILPSGSLYTMGNYDSSLEIFRYQNILAIHKSISYTHGS